MKPGSYKTKKGVLNVKVSYDVAARSPTSEEIFGNLVTPDPESEYLFCGNLQESLEMEHSLQMRDLWMNEQ